jgi:hypothetical protein
MADLIPVLDVVRPLLYGDPMRNMRGPMLPAMPPFLSFSVFLGERGYQLSVICVYVLVNSLMAYRMLRIINGDSAGDLLWRPSTEKLFGNILADGIVFQPISRMRVAFTALSSFMSPVPQIVTFMDGWCIAFEFPGNS